MDIYLSSSLKDDIKDSAAIASDRGLNLEISRFGKIALMDEKYDEYLEYYLSVLKHFPNKISLHGFFSGLSVICKDRAIVEISRRRFLQSLRIAEKLGAHTVVFHSGYDLTNKMADYKERFVSSQICFWSEFISNFERAGITAVIENTSEPEPELLLKVVDDVGSSNLKLCLDCGHANVASNVQVENWIKVFGKYLHHTHMHNNDGIFDLHQGFSEGTLDFVSIIKQLKASPVKDYVLEMFSENQVIDSLAFFE